MDYRAYYLKNYLDEKNKPKKYVANDFRQTRQDKEDDLSNPQVIYIQSPEAEKKFSKREESFIEYVPQEKSIFNHGKPASKKKNVGVFRKIVIFILTIILSVLLTFVVGDVITDGDLIYSVFKLTSGSKDDGKYYLVALAINSNSTDARLSASAVRLKGGGGFIYKVDKTYYIIGDCFADKADAKTVVEKNDGSVIVEISVPKIKYNFVDKKDVVALEGYLKYGLDIQEELGSIVEQYLGKRIDKAMSQDMVYQMRISLEEKINSIGISFAKYNEKQEIIQIKADMAATKGMLENICNNELSRPNFVCDVRYYKSSVLVNYINMLNSL